MVCCAKLPLLLSAAFYIFSGSSKQKTIYRQNVLKREMFQLNYIWPMEQITRLLYFENLHDKTSWQDKNSYYYHYNFIAYKMRANKFTNQFNQTFMPTNTQSNYQKLLCRFSALCKHRLLKVNRVSLLLHKKLNWIFSTPRCGTFIYLYIYILHTFDSVEFVHLFALVLFYLLFCSVVFFSNLIAV